MWLTKPEGRLILLSMRQAEGTAVSEPPSASWECPMSLCGVLPAAVSPWLLIEGSLVLGVVLAIVFVSRAARQRRSPTATLAWVMAIVLIPFIGVPLYVVFGGRKIRRIAG